MNAPVTHAEFKAVLRSDLTAVTEKVFATVSPGDQYEPNWHIDAMTEALRKVFVGETRRLLITVPPRHLKSITTAVSFPAWALGHDPTLKFLVASYGGELAAKHARDFRMVMEAQFYGQFFPRTVTSPKRNVAFEYETALNGSRRAVSLGGALTGLGADFLIVDDLMKAGDASSAVERQRVKDFYEQTLFTRLNDKRRGAIIAIQQRLHEDDLAGYLIEKGEFTHLNLRAVAEEDKEFDLGHGRRKYRRRGEALFEAREPLPVLAEIRTSIGLQAFIAQYMQNPTAPGGNLVRFEKCQTYDVAPDRERLFHVAQSWDVAVTATPQSDYSVCTTWGFLAPTAIRDRSVRPTPDVLSLFLRLRRI